MSDSYRQVVLTGGPGAGKTAILELLKNQHPPHLYMVPEAATIAYSGGFPRADDDDAHRITQLAIYHLQIQLEAFARSRAHISAALCDRGTVDGVAYWPGDPEQFWLAAETTYERELSRYYAVIHLRTPQKGHGYNRENSVRIESADQAALIDERIARAWREHPRCFAIDACDNFMEKARATLALIHAQIAFGAE